jgi:hypothetical protein
MNANLTLRGRRILPLLALGVVLAAPPSPIHAGMLTSRLTDRATLVVLGLTACCPTAHIVYEAQAANQPKAPNAKQQSRSSALAALMLTLVIPAGTVPEMSDSPPPPPPPSPPGPPGPPGSTDSTPPGGGQTSGGPTPPSTPEPGTLMLALTGAATAMLPWLRRRRQFA